MRQKFRVFYTRLDEVYDKRKDRMADGFLGIVHDNAPSWATHWKCEPEGLLGLDGNKHVRSMGVEYGDGLVNMDGWDRLVRS